MYALVVEYGPRPADHPPLALRWRYRDLLAQLPGYRRRLGLQADGYRRLVEVFLFATPEAVEAALADAGRRQFVDAHSCCAATGAGLLACPGDALGSPAVLLRQTQATSPTGGQLC